MKLNFYNISFFLFSFRFEWMSDGIKQVRFPLRQYSGFIQVHLSHWLQTGRWWHPLWRYATLKKIFNVYTFSKHNWFTIRCWICLCDHAFEFFKLFFYWLIFFFIKTKLLAVEMYPAFGNRLLELSHFSYVGRRHN